MNLTHLFDLTYTGRANTIGLEWEGAEYTFADIDSRSNRMAQVLLSWGLSAGDRLCVYLPNSLVLIDLFLAATKAGIIFVPINILYRDREITHILADADPTALVTDAEIETRLPLWRTADLLKAAEEAINERPAACPDGDDPALIIYTSGTTGASKGAVLSHNNLIANAINLVTCWQFTSDDRLLLALPLFHVHALGNGLHCWLLSGCRMRLLERFEHAKAIAEFEDFGPTVFFGVPTMYVRLLEWDSAIAANLGGSVRLFVSGSAPLPAQVLEDFEQKFGHRILERYGMSETLMNISNPYIGERRAGSVGLPLPGVRVRLRKEDGTAPEVGETGEVQLQGPNLFLGYWRRPEATEAAFVDGGWFKTGDLAVKEPDGYYTLCGRRSDLIISGGYNIYPREIEEFLLELDGVIEAAVAARPDPMRGEVPVAFYVGDAEPIYLEAACRQKLASFKLPRAFQRIESLPRNAMGKVQKHLLPKG